MTIKEIIEWCSKNKCCPLYMALDKNGKFDAYKKLRGCTKSELVIRHPSPAACSEALNIKYATAQDIAHLWDNKQYTESIEKAISAGVL